MMNIQYVQIMSELDKKKKTLIFLQSDHSYRLKLGDDPKK